MISNPVIIYKEKTTKPEALLALKVVTNKPLKKQKPKSLNNLNLKNTDDVLFESYEIIAKKALLRQKPFFKKAFEKMVLDPTSYEFFIENEYDRIFTDLELDMGYKREFIEEALKRFYQTSFELANYFEEEEPNWEQIFQLAKSSIQEEDVLFEQYFGPQKLKQYQEFNRLGRSETLTALAMYSGRNWEDL